MSTFESSVGTEQDTNLDLLSQNWVNPTANKPGTDLNGGGLFRVVGVGVLLVLGVLGVTPLFLAFGHNYGVAKLAAEQVYAVDTAYSTTHDLDKALAPVLGDRVYSAVHTSAKQLPGGKYALTLTTDYGFAVMYDSRSKKYDTAFKGVSSWYNWRL